MLYLLLSCLPTKLREKVHMPVTPVRPKPVFQTLRQPNEI
jgi:hypothetical protein